MEIDFVKCSPAQNMTVLVKTKLPTAEYPHIAAHIMAYSHLYAEQVGFIEAPAPPAVDARLRMAGGEFCGNACMSLAAYLAAERGLRHNELAELQLECSGADAPVRCRVEKTPRAYKCEVSMPVPERIERATAPFADNELRLGIVRYRDFVHMLIEVEQFDDTSRHTAQQLAKLLGVASGGSLVGILLYKTSSVVGACELAPLIYVPGVGSMVWERGCGSGTASLGAFLAWERQSTTDIPVKQPGGTIDVCAMWDGGAVASLTIKGTVDIVAQGTAFIELQEGH